MSTRCFNFDTLPTCDSHRYYVITHLSTFRYSNIENVINKIPNRSKHSHSKLEHEEHTQKFEKLQEVEPKNNIQHKPKPQQQNSNLTSKLKSKKFKKNPSQTHKKSQILQQNSNPKKS